MRNSEKLDDESSAVIETPRGLRDNINIGFGDLG